MNESETLQIACTAQVTFILFTIHSSSKNTMKKKTKRNTIHELDAHFFFFFLA
ncbi:hypothetical protein IscW_ISCW000782 [Ixodes scapularis]|uniref:Uncharacterized protein n=1 Tax=Ixodes scapularis TaxID=6945 RepID=B7P5X9_IXOSC|nr:hypothetical protein IscW_ISCW000782 [Ixodes scapularis]|eukprot:XP_002408066.1 hypothetical protein IscW_ISCW000782 [Ixodes scapularis]